MQDSTLGVTTLFAQIKLALPANLALVKLETELCQLPDALRAFGHNCADYRFVT
jgi:hypothetical protein